MMHLALLGIMYLLTVGIIDGKSVVCYDRNMKYVLAYGKHYASPLAT